MELAVGEGRWSAVLAMLRSAGSGWKNPSMVGEGAFMRQWGTRIVRVWQLTLTNDICLSSGSFVLAFMVESAERQLPGQEQSFAIVARPLTWVWPLLLPQWAGWRHDNSEMKCCSLCSLCDKGVNKQRFKYYNLGVEFSAFLNCKPFYFTSLLRAKRPPWNLS